MEASGTSYIVGMYGYKIAIMTYALAAALKNHLSRRMLLWITLLAIVLFVIASGGTISAIRAAIMGSFVAMARGTGRVFNARNAVTIAAVGMVMMNATLLTDAAFQLSFLSFWEFITSVRLSIIFFTGPMAAYCNGRSTRCFRFPPIWRSCRS